MTNTRRSYFEEMYASKQDPWEFETSWYEQRKYSLTMAALPRARYSSAFEPGCSIGVLSSLLALRCGSLLATEIIPSALDQARQRLKHLPHVTVEQAAIPEDWPDGTFDLIVLSELAYYFDAETLREIADLAISSIAPCGTLIGVHWRGKTDYPLSGDDAHLILNGHPALERKVQHIESDVLLDVWERV